MKKTYIKPVVDKDVYVTENMLAASGYKNEYSTAEQFGRGYIEGSEEVRESGRTESHDAWQEW